MLRKGCFIRACYSIVNIDLNKQIRQLNQSHYYMVEPGRNLYYVPALFSAPHMSYFGTKKILFSSAIC
jgi:hypothetical protein